MPDIDNDTVARWWRETRTYDWNALRAGLDTIFAQEIIDLDTYQRLQAAVTELINLGVDFPKTPSELQIRINHYM